MRDDFSTQALIDLYDDLGRRVSAHTSAAGAMQAVAEVAVGAVPGADCASITRRRADRYETAASTDTAALDGDRLQYDLHSGPCVDAVDIGDVIRTDDLETDERWPRYGPLAVQTVGVRSVLSIRLRLDESDTIERAGLNIYSRAVDAFDETSLTVGALLATHASLAVAAAAAREHAANLEIALSTNRTIGIAIGVLMTTYKLTENKSFDLLRMASQHTHRKLRDIALDVVTTGTLELPPLRRSEATEKSGAGVRPTTSGAAPPAQAGEESRRHGRPR
jgi:hypothetical protein